MAKEIQLLLPLEEFEAKVRLSKEAAKDIVASMAMLLLQALAVEEGKEEGDDR